MPVPKEAFTIEGGCNCNAIRYKIDIPAFDSRPFRSTIETPLDPKDEVRLPYIITDHCNDCRKATGSIMAFWICSPPEMISVSCIARSGESETLKPTPWVTAAEVFRGHGPQTHKTFLTFYKSSPDVSRGFCGRCGTNLTFYGKPPEGYTEMIDIVLGTIDREYLEGYQLSPERQLEWDFGIDWIQKLSIEGQGHLPKYHDYKLDEEVK